jgi:GAF domain-containing protein
LFDVPAVLITLVDEHRQWFKSCFGLQANETSREVSFCAHAIHQRDIMVVPDTLQDHRFAGNPVVVDGPRVRFYAGCPLFLPDGNCVGTLCIVDQRPRQLSTEEARLLRDLGALVERELRESAAA